MVQKINSPAKKILLIMLMTAVLWTSLQPQKASANPLLAAGGVQAGALAFWGGAVLVAMTGTAVGMDPTTSQAIRDFGKSAWDGANESIRQSMTASTQYMATGWNTAQRYSVKWSGEVYQYLTQKWNDFFKNGVKVNATTGKITGIATIAGTFLPSRVEVNNRNANPWQNIGLRAGGDEVWKVSVDSIGLATVQFYQGQFAGWVNFRKEDGTTYKNAMEAYADVARLMPLYYNANTVPANFIDSSSSMYIRASIPAGNTSFATMNLPAPRGLTNSDGTVNTIEMPNIGKVGAVTNGNVAVTYKDYINAGDETINTPTKELEDYVVSLPENGAIDLYLQDRPYFDLGVVYSPADVPLPQLGIVISPPIATANPMTGRITGTVAGDAVITVKPLNPALTKTLTIPLSVKAGTAPIEGNPSTDWPDKLKAAVTTRFPFSLPWDMAYLINLFVAPPQVPVINVDAGPIKFNITLNQLDAYLPYFRAFLIAAFLFGLIMKTRSLLGGGK